MSMLRTILFDYKLIQTSISARTLVHSDNVSFLSTNGLDIKEGILTSNQQFNLSNITGALFIRCNSTLNIAINGGSPSSIDSLFVNFGSINNIVLTNSGITDVSYIILSA